MHTFPRTLDPMHGYQATLAIAAAALCYFAYGFGLGSPTAVVGLACVAAAAERGRVRLGDVTEVSISLLPTVFAAAMFGPLAGMIVAAASFVGDFPLLLDAERRTRLTARGAPYLKWGIYTSIRAVYGASAGFVASAAAHVVGDAVVGVVVATVVAAVVAEPLDVLFGAMTLRLRGGDVRSFLRMFTPMLFGAMSLYTPVVALLAVAYAEVSPWTIAFFFVPALVAQRLFALYQDQRRLAADLGEVNLRLETANLSFATALVTTLDARDRYTAGHSAAVAIYARDIAERMGLPPEQQQLAHLCGLVHDIGKIGLPAGLLEKPGALTLDERREMQRHSTIGERILAKVETYGEVAQVVRHHHERVDGEGYPDGIAGDNIPLLSRIIAVADAYNAMTSDRPYRDAMPARVARLRIAQAVGSQFDTAVVAAFEAILATARDAYCNASRSDFKLAIQESVAGQEVSLPAQRLALAT